MNGVQVTLTSFRGSGQVATYPSSLDLGLELELELDSELADELSMSDIDH